MKNREKIKHVLRSRRHGRVRAKVNGTADKPRLSVYRSLNYIQAQIIDDVAGKTLVASSDKKMSVKETKDMSKSVGSAYQVGEIIAKSAVAKGIKKVVFDKGHYKYHGRVKALAEGARKGGLIF